MDDRTEKFVVIFSAVVDQIDEEYGLLAARLRALACEQYGCLAFESLSEGRAEVTLSYWPDEESIRRWKMHADHVAAQRLGRRLWYSSYRVQVAKLIREYEVKNNEAGGDG